MRIPKAVWIISFPMFLLYGCSTETEKFSEKDIPESVLNSFHKMYPEAKDKSFQMEQGLYLIDFSQNMNSMKVLFNPQGRWLESEVRVGREEIPQAVIDSVGVEINKGFGVIGYAKRTYPDRPLEYLIRLKDDSLLLELGYAADGQLRRMRKRRN